MPDSTPAPPLSAPEAIVRRRSTRRFDPDRPLSEATLTQVLRLATYAPSPHNLQPWRFLVVRRASNRRTLRACAFNRAELTDAPVNVVVLAYHHPDRSHLAPMLATMRALGAATPELASELRARAVRSLSRMSDRASWASLPAHCATATLLIAAESLGVSSCLLDRFDPSKIRDAFGVPDDHSVSALLALGHALDSPPFPGRFPLSDVSHEEHFGQPWTLGDD